MKGVTLSKRPIGSLFSKELEEKYKQSERERQEKLNPPKPAPAPEPPKPPKIIPQGYTRRRIMGGEQEYGITPAESWGFHLHREGFLENGCRLYSDCGHPEYASPEASNPLDAVLYDKAGELLVPRCVDGHGYQRRFIKNNLDSQGNSYGAHESYGLARSDMNNFANFMLGFLTTRIIFAGAGTINNGYYEISQRARVTNCNISQNTTGGERPIFNTRDEPLADSNQLMRLHIISGDANLSEFALFLKYGTTSLVLDLFEDKRPCPVIFDSAIESFRGISRDLRLERKYSVQRIRLDKHADQATLESIAMQNKKDMLARKRRAIESQYSATYDPQLRTQLSREFRDYETPNNPIVQEEIKRLKQIGLPSMVNGEMSAIEVQRAYLMMAEKEYRDRDEMTNQVLDSWKFTLDTLGRDPMLLATKLDWVIKKNLIDSYIKRHNVSSLHDSSVRDIDLRYHDIDRENGLFYKLQRAGLIDRLLTDEQIEHAVSNPPEDTRAFLRGKAMQKRYSNERRILGVDWSRISIGKLCSDCGEYHECDRTRFDLQDPLKNYSHLLKKLPIGDRSNEQD